MNRNYLKYAIDVGLAVTFFTALITGIIKFPGLMHYFGISFRQLPMRQINWLHDWFGLVMGLLVMFHLYLNWKWIVLMTKEIFGKKK